MATHNITPLSRPAREHEAKTIALLTENSGPAATWTCPDTDSVPIPDPCPTFSTAAGTLELIARLQAVFIRATRAQICGPIQVARYVTDYRDGGTDLS